MISLSKIILSFIFSWPVIYSYTLFIFISSLIRLDIPKPLLFPFYDKLLHILNYAVLAFIIVNTVNLKTKQQNRVFALTYAFILGLIVEIIQFFLPYRAFDVIDMLCNFTGGFIGGLFLLDIKAR
ncbi:MAG: VanZ family protein [Candidatus Omnitrophica bacterium]|jgi:VanZ family protein|nr:VanZ family protein [Candidatus Omnitrophota bacterium]